MIVVIADDFTGAAEIGGMGLKYGLEVEVFTSWPIESNADLVVMATNTRSKSSEEARKETTELINYIKTLNPDWIYKKIDSVLRGHILVEICSMQEALNCKKSIVIPSNPKLYRIIKDCVYYINDVPIKDTNFAHDPEYELESSVVTEILSCGSCCSDIYCVKPGVMDKPTGIFIGEVKDDEDMKVWAEKEYKDTVIAGAAGFFEAFLIKNGYQLKTDFSFEESDNIHRLIVCGSAHPESRSFLRKAKESGLPVSYMSDDIFNSDDISEAEIENWKEEIITQLNTNNESIIAIQQPVIRNSEIATQLISKLAKVVKRVNDNFNVNEFVIEGGATASAVLDLLGFSTLEPIYQYNQGIIRLKVKKHNEINIVLKPGSYIWPTEVISHNLTIN